MSTGASTGRPSSTRRSRAGRASTARWARSCSTGSSSSGCSASARRRSRVRREPLTFASRAAAAALLVVLAAGAALADRTSAEYLAQRADKALKARDFAGAQTLFRKALDEDATFLPAEEGLAEALLGAGDQAAGVEEYRKLL